MLIDAKQACLLVIDYQARLAPAIADHLKVIEQGVQLIRLADRLELPIVLTEHCPDKLGASVESVQMAAARASVVHKVCFSAWAQQRLDATAVAGCDQIIVCGTETHVCVLQTVLDLRAAGKQVYVVAEACGSRTPANHELALARMRAHGVDIVSREMVAFEILRSASDPRFSSILRDFIR